MYEALFGNRENVWMVIISCQVFHIFRSRLQRKFPNIDDAGNDPENDLEEVIIGQRDFRGSYRFSEVVGVYTWPNLIFIKAWLDKWAVVGGVLATGLLSV